MGGMGPLVGDVLRVALGIDTPFSWALWAFVTVVVLVVGVTMGVATPGVIDPVAVQAGSRPNRVLLWMPLSVLAFLGLVLFLAVTIVGIPFAGMLVPVFLVTAGLGYIALARLLGDRLVRRLGSGGDVHPAVAMLVGLLLLRALRLVPFIGAAAHSLVGWYGLAATTVVAWDVAWSWHRRRMPDAEQFAGETLVEWYPDGDPDDGRPSVGTGRPVLDNVRGDEGQRVDQPPV